MTVTIPSTSKNSLKLKGIVPSTLGLSLLQSTNKLTISSGIVTSNTPILDLSQTWNNVSITFSGIKLNVTDTASASDSLLANFQVGGSRVLEVAKTGVIKLSASLASSMALTTGDVGTGFGFANGRAAWFYGGANYGQFDNDGIQFNYTGARLCWAANKDAVADLYIYRDAANTLALRNGGNAQAFGVYNTYTSSTNYERVSLEFISNVARLFTSAQIGTQRNLAIGGTVVQFWSGTTLTQRWNVDLNGHLTANTDNTYDIGASGANRPRSVHVGTSVVAGKLSIRDSYTYGQPQIYHETIGTDVGFQIVQLAECAIYGSGKALFSTNTTTGVRVCGDAPFGFTNGHALQTPDVTLYRDASDTLALRRGLVAQTFNIYNTFSGATVHERLAIWWDTNVATIETQKGSVSGTARALRIGTSGNNAIHFRTNGSDRWQISTAGTLVAYDDNTYDIGASGANRPRSVHVGTSVDSPIYYFGGTTSSYPRLSRAATYVKVRLADNSDYAVIQGKLMSHANAVAETVTPTHTITLYDAAGVAYKVPCVAA